MSYSYKCVIYAYIVITSYLVSYSTNKSSVNIPIKPTKSPFQTFFNIFCPNLTFELK